MKISVEFLTEEIKDVKGKVERVDKRVTTAEKRIGELENKVAYRISPDTRGGGICAFTVCPNNQEKKIDRKY